MLPPRLKNGLDGFTVVCILAGVPGLFIFRRGCKQTCFFAPIPRVVKMHQPPSWGYCWTGTGSNACPSAVVPFSQVVPWICLNSPQCLAVLRVVLTAGRGICSADNHKAVDIVKGLCAREGREARVDKRELGTSLDLLKKNHRCFFAFLLAPTSCPRQAKLRFGSARSRPASAGV